MELKDRVISLVEEYGGTLHLHGAKKVHYRFSSNEERIAFMTMLKSKDPDYEVCHVDNYANLDSEDDYRSFDYLVLYCNGLIDLTGGPSTHYYLTINERILMDLLNDYGMIKKIIPKFEI